MRRYPGTLVPQAHSAIGGGEVLAPYIAVLVRLGGSALQTDLLIDTGADTTTLGPWVSIGLLGDSYFELLRTSPEERVVLVGVGPGASRAIAREAELILRDEDGDPRSITLPVLITLPDPRGPDQTNWFTPSLLGRDVLQELDLRLSYRMREVGLSEPSG